MVAVLIGIGIVVGLTLWRLWRRRQIVYAWLAGGTGNTGAHRSGLLGLDA